MRVNLRKWLLKIPHYIFNSLCKFCYKKKKKQFSIISILLTYIIRAILLCKCHCNTNTKNLKKSIIYNYRTYDLYIFFKFISHTHVIFFFWQTIYCFQSSNVLLTKKKKREIKIVSRWLLPNYEKQHIT